MVVAQAAASALQGVVRDKLKQAGRSYQVVTAQQTQKIEHIIMP